MWILDENGTVEVEIPCALRGWPQLRLEIWWKNHRDPVDATGFVHETTGILMDHGSFLDVSWFLGLMTENHVCLRNQQLCLQSFKPYISETDQADHMGCH